MTNEELRELRERNGLSQAEFASVLGTSEDAVRRAERGSRPLGKRAQARLSEWDGDGTTPTVTSEDGSVTRTAETEDELPEPPYNPGVETPEDALDEEEEEEKPKRSARRRRAAAPRAMTGWQAEAQQFLAGLIKGNAIPVQQPDGATSQIVIPGLAHGVQALWCPTCAVIVAQAADAWAAAFVKSYPQLAKRMLVPGPQAELVIVTVTQIAIPCAVHHLHKPHIAAAAANGATASE